MFSFNLQINHIAFIQGNNNQLLYSCMQKFQHPSHLQQTVYKSANIIVILYLINKTCLWIRIEEHYITNGADAAFIFTT